jgi:molecular chaperone GrpE
MSPHDQQWPAAEAADHAGSRQTDGPAEPDGRPSPDQGGPPPPQPEQAAADAEALARTVAELEDRWRRALADLDNLRKRYERELRREREAERARGAEVWLPVVDDIERALAHADADPQAVIAGVRAVRDQAVAVLAKLGYPRHDEVGVPFDPSVHEVVSVVDDPEAPPGTVVGVLRAGYGEPGHQLRPAAVAVSKRE